MDEVSHLPHVQLLGAADCVLRTAQRAAATAANLHCRHHRHAAGAAALCLRLPAQHLAGRSGALGLHRALHQHGHPGRSPSTLSLCRPQCPTMLLVSRMQKVLPFNLVSAAYLTQAKSTHAPLREMLSSALSSRLLELVCVCAGGTAAGANKVGAAVLHPSPVPAGKVRLPQAGGCSSRTGNRGPGAARHRDGGRGGGMCHLHEPAGCRADILADGDSVRALLPHQLPKQVDGRQNGMPHLPAAAAAALNPSLASF